MTCGFPELLKGFNFLIAVIGLLPAAWAHALHRAEGLCLGPHRQHVPRPYRRLIVVLTTVPWWAAMLRIPFSVIAPVIIVICAIGAYTVHSSMFDVVMMLVFGVMGYLFKKLKDPLAPWVMAMVLGDMAEASFRQAMLLSQGSLGIFWSNPLVGRIAALALLLLLWPLVGNLNARLRAQERAARG